MRLSRACCSVLVLILLFSTAQLFAQDGLEPDAAASFTVPRFVRFSGSIPDRQGTGGVSFALYATQTGGAPLWLETQNVTLDANGRYSVLLGAGSRRGVPLRLFAAGEARWIGVRPEGGVELPRVALVSVPYSLKAGDADTLGGLPASAFVLATPGVDQPQNHRNTAAVAQAAAYISGTVGTIAKFTSTSDVGDSIMTDNGTAVTINGDTVYTGTARRIMGNFNAPNHGDRLLYMNSNADASTIVGYMPSGTGHAAAVNIYGTSNATQTSVGQFRIDVNNWNTAVGDVVAMRSFGTCPNGATSCTGGTALPISFQFAQPNSAEQEVMRILANGKVGIGTTTPGQKLSVAGAIESTTGGFRFPDGSTQTSAAVGDITGVTAGSGLSGGGTSGAVTLSLLTGCAPNQLLKWSGTAWGCSDDLVGSGGGAYLPLTGGTLTGPLTGTRASFSGSTAPPTYILTATQTASGPAPPQGAVDPSFINTVPAAIVGVAQPASGLSAGVVGQGASGNAVGVVGISATDSPAMLAWNTATNSWGDAIDAMTSSTNWGAAVYAQALATSGNAFGIQAETFSPGGYAGSFNNYAGGYIIWAGVGEGQNSQRFAVTGSSADFNVNVHVNGSLSASSKNFKIDHPLDPANKYLYHTSVESPDMKNVYDGIVVLDRRGQAWVTMPEWFEALNQDFRYQLTSIGAPGPNLYIAREISGNRFQIAGGRPGMKVSWQVTGTRHDAWANAHRIPVEEEKTGNAKGTYLSPELFQTTEVAQKK